MEDYFGWPYVGTWLLVFAGCWIYCIAEYGFLLGGGLGWLPAGIVATLAALLWPLIWLAVAGIVLLVVWALKQA